MTPIVSATMRLTGRIVPRAALDGAQRTGMFSLLCAHFAGVDWDTFGADLAEKNFALLLEDASGRLRGFSTLLVYASRVKPGVTVVYSGDTIVERGWWGSPALPLTWLRAVRNITPSYEGREVWWLLLTSGFRTYRFLPVFFRRFTPRYDDSTHDQSSNDSTVDECALLAMLAAERFGDRFDAASGIVRLARPQTLVPELLDVPDGRAADRDIAFFLERNPGYVDGDELACLSRIDESNLTPAARRIARSL
jgi:hypothetical protein